MSYFISYKSSNDLVLVDGNLVAGFDDRKTAEAFAAYFCRLGELPEGACRVVSAAQVSSRQFALLQLTRHKYLRWNGAEWETVRLEAGREPGSDG